MSVGISTPSRRRKNGKPSKLPVDSHPDCKHCQKERKDLALQKSQKGRFDLKVTVNLTKLLAFPLIDGDQLIKLLMKEIGSDFRSEARDWNIKLSKNESEPSWYELKQKRHHYEFVWMGLTATRDEANTLLETAELVLDNACENVGEMLKDYLSISARASKLEFKALPKQQAAWDLLTPKERKALALRLKIKDLEWSGLPAADRRDNWQVLK